VAKYINETISGKFDEQDLNELYSRVDSTEQKIKDFTEHCQSGPAGSYLKYIGTSSTIRDLVSLGDAIVGKGEPIDYWGISYGTVIGFNFINSEFFRLFNCTLSRTPGSSVSRGMSDSVQMLNPMLSICSALGM
jgi:hypothetical protein